LKGIVQQEIGSEHVLEAMTLLTSIVFTLEAFSAVRSTGIWTKYGCHNGMPWFPGIFGKQAYGILSQDHMAFSIFLVGLSDL